MTPGDLTYDEMQRLRRLVNPRADEHLYEWGRWRHAYYRAGCGYPRHSAGFGGWCGYSRDFEDIAEDMNHTNAEISDAIIDELTLQHKIAIQHVYEAAVWRFNRLKLEDVLVEATNAFWAMAQRKGLI
jgi:hypothetical protein